MSLSTLSFTTIFFHVDVKRRENLLAKLVLSNMCGGVTSVRIAVAMDLLAIADLLHVVVWLAFQAAPGKDFAPLIYGT